MKFGPRKPSFKKSFKARTTGKAKRKLKKSFNPTYGKKGMGWIKDPKRAAYNKVYNKTSFSVLPGGSRSSKSDSSSNLNFGSDNTEINASDKYGCGGCLGCSGILLSFLFPPLLIITIPFTIYMLIKMSSEQEKEQAEREKQQTIHEYSSELIEKTEVLERIINKAESTNVPDTFFKLYDDIKRIMLESEELMKEMVENDLGIDQDHYDETMKEFEKISDELLKSFIKRYEDKSFEKATRLKTEKGQRNNYQRSFDDLYEFSSYFNEDIENYIKERWQEI